MIKILVADDESHARKKILSFLKKSGIDALLIEAVNGVETFDMIQDEAPDLVFLDIQMPGLTGFEVIEKIGVESIPSIIFVTAFDQYAINAFEINAVDYLLKPFDYQRFDKSLKRALKHLDQENKNEESIKFLLNEVNKEKKSLSRLLVNVGHKYFFVDTVDIIFITAEEKYVNIHTQKGKYLLRETMTNMNSSLDGEKFVRVHRSFIVNIDHIKEIQPWSHGDYIIILKNGKEIPVSRRYKNALFEK